MNRRKVLGILAGLGIGSPIFNRALASMAQEDTPITAKMIQEAEWISGLELTDEQRDQAARALESARDNLTALREVKLTNDVGPAVHFRSLTPMASRTHEKLERAPAMVRTEPEPRPESDEEIAYLPVTQLASLIQRKLISSTELTKLYLRRIHKYNPLLNCVVQVTEDLAIKQAKQADQEIAAGKYRGPLHGIPWGAKDLISVPGYPTTWGAPQYRKQELATQATVVQRLEEAGAVLVAKLTLGALAMGDKWFGGFTRCPWNYRVGSSGSSAGSASAVVAGLAGFTIGTETLGSIISPSRRCGATGLRPTFGRVSREGCMALAWSMDKVGPLARSVEDCALVLAAIHGADGKDFTA
ncbi:MAG: amidase, partial [Planctomycetota bacterium]|nr:amidase [Planctomycetota bacterium]